MIKFNFRKISPKVLYPIILFVLILIIALIIYIVNKNNSGPQFRVSKIISYNSANIVNKNLSNQYLMDLSIDQFSDISIYIDNGIKDETKLNKENTVKALYIDNIYIDTLGMDGTKILNYKNPNKFGKYLEIQPASERIEYNIISTNKQNDNANYDLPSFYTDCSNPIALGYLNKDIITNYAISDSQKKVNYNAKVLKDANIDFEDINPKINFTIHIVNNLNKKYSCKVSIENILDQDFVDTGYSYIINNISSDRYNFKKE